MTDEMKKALDACDPAVLKKSITHDIHTHTHLSLCCSEPGIPNTYVENAEKRGIKILGFSDHMWDKAVPKPVHNPWYDEQDFEHICKVREELTYRSDKVKILFGAETEFCNGEVLAISEACAEKLDYLLVPHSHTHMVGFVISRECADDDQKHADFLVRSFYALVTHPLHKYITAVAHPLTPGGCPPERTNRILSLIPDSALIECFDAARDAGVGFEINGGAFHALGYPDEYIRILKQAKKSGLKFSLGSDGHGVTGLDCVEIAGKLMQLAGITSDDFIDLVK